LVCKNCDQQIIKIGKDWQHINGWTHCYVVENCIAEPKEEIQDPIKTLGIGFGPVHMKVEVAPVGMKGGVVRQFETGATRDTDTNKYDYEGFFHPLVMQRYAEYMHKHRVQKDGSLRDSDNWQKGMPLSVYMKSLYRHFMDVWKGHRETYSDGKYLEDALCGVIFNTMGYLATLLTTRGYKARKESGEDETKNTISCSTSPITKNANEGFYRPSHSPYDLSAKRPR
jgi:hypothetical protein